MNSTKEILEYNIIPSIYENISAVFPEFNFKRITNGYVSTTDQKVTGESGKKGKVYIYDNNPSYFIDYTRGNISIWEYVQQQKKLSNQETLLFLARLANVTLPKQNENYLIEQKQYRKLWEDINDFFITSLHQLESTHPIIKYLENRGYNSEEMKQMGLGYIPSQEELVSYLMNEKKYNSDDIIFSFNQSIGVSHKISIPYRNAIGEIRGFVFRTIDEEVSPKYLYSKELKRSDILFNLKSVHTNYDLVIVEGLLDSLHADVKGIPNVVALGGTSLNETQIKEAVKRGARKFTLCLDNDESGKEATIRAIHLINNTVENAKIYVSSLPDNIKDPDQLIKEKGIKAFNHCIQDALRDYSYLLSLIFEKYSEYGELTSKNFNDFTEKVLILGHKIENPIDRDIYLSQLDNILKNNNISKESFEQVIEELRFKKIQEKKRKEVSKLIQNVQDLNEKGKVNDALELLNKQSKQLNANTTDNQFENLLKSTNEDDVQERMSKKPTSLHTNLKIQEEDLLLPSGAISIFAAPTSHGKTTFLINLALNVALNDPKKQVYFFSFEEDSDSILTNALNTFVNIDFCKNNRRAIRHFYSENTDSYLGRGASSFHEGRKVFFNQLIHNNRLNIHYTDYSTDKLIEAIYYLKKNTNIGAVFIDYMQLLRKGTGKYNSRQEELKQICLELKDVAIETGLPIILGAQFNREVTHHLKVHSTNIGEAGDIERIANLIVGFWNNDFQPYGKDADMGEITQKNINSPNSIYIKILKNRAGRVGIDDVLSYKSNTGKIENRNKSNPF